MLAREVRALGYEIETGVTRKAVIPVSRFAEFRRTAREVQPAKSSARSRDRGVRHEEGRQPTDNEVAVLVRESRADKLTEISTGELRGRQRAGLTVEDERILADLQPDRMPTGQAVESSKPSLEHAKQHIFERVSVARDHELLTEALRHGRGRIRAEDLKGELAMQESSGRILRNGREIATEESLERERRMIAAIDRGLGSFEPLGHDRVFLASDRLQPEQKSAIESVLRSRDRAVSISGAAGTGKTATL